MVEVVYSRNLYKKKIKVRENTQKIRNLRSEIYRYEEAQKPTMKAQTFAGNPMEQGKQRVKAQYISIRDEGT